MRHIWYSFQNPDTIVISWNTADPHKKVTELAESIGNAFMFQNMTDSVRHQLTEHLKAIVLDLQSQRLLPDDIVVGEPIAKPSMTYWLEDFDVEVRRLFGENLPKDYNIKNFEIDIELMPEEAAAQYFAGYHIL